MAQQGLIAEHDEETARTTEAKPPQPIAPFHRFNRLPMELREMIWNFALDEPRVLEVYNGVVMKHNIDWTPSTVDFEPTCQPFVTQVCRESWDALVRRGCVRVIDYGVIPSKNASSSAISRGLRFLPKSDVSKISSFLKPSEQLLEENLCGTSLCPSPC